MSRFISVSDAIDIRLLGNNDLTKRDRMRLSKWSKYVWQDLNLTTVKIVKRELFDINKRTNTIDLPCDYLQLSSVNVIDRCGNIIPIFRNQENLKGSDVVDIPSSKDCGCEYNCGYKLCNTIKNYESIVHTETDKTPVGADIEFTCVDRKGIQGGYLYEQKQYPLRQYVSGVWVDTILHTETTKLCEVEVDANGCCCDSTTNIDAVCTACGITNLDQQCVVLGGNANCPPNENDNTWIYWCSTKLDWFSVQCGCYPGGFRKNCANYYNISELGNRLIFPHNFGWDKVLIRYYVDAGFNELLIPFIAVDTFVTGLMWWDCRFNDNKQNLAKVYENDYTKLKWGLLLELNKYRMAEQRMIMTPPVFVPSYLYQNGGMTDNGNTFYDNN